MIDDLLRQGSGITLPTYLVIILIIGSIVDIFQFMWLIKKGFSQLRSQVYNQVEMKLKARLWEDEDGQRLRSPQKRRVRRRTSGAKEET